MPLTHEKIKKVDVMHCVKDCVVERTDTTKPKKNMYLNTAEQFPFFLKNLQTIYLG